MQVLVCWISYGINYESFDVQRTTVSTKCSKFHSAHDYACLIIIWFVLYSIYDSILNLIRILTNFWIHCSHFRFKNSIFIHKTSSEKLIYSMCRMKILLNVLNRIKWNNSILWQNWISNFQNWIKLKNFFFLWKFSVFLSRALMVFRFQILDLKGFSANCFGLLLMVLVWNNFWFKTLLLKDFRFMDFV